MGECETEPVRDKHPFLRGPFCEFIRQFAVLAAAGRGTCAVKRCDLLSQEIALGGGFNIKSGKMVRLLYYYCHVLYYFNNSFGAVGIQ